jgi:hypothetical protein
MALRLKRLEGGEQQEGQGESAGAAVDEFAAFHRDAWEFDDREQYRGDFCG